jgi:biopolymer transport protein ExbD
MWKVRHQGSPTSLGDLSLAQVAEGLADGRWEPTDEVMGPDDKDWVPLEIHPQLEEIAAELEPPPPRHYDDETRLDMNALIDVCLVLLIFFILTTSYAIMQKQLEAPGVSADKGGPPIITKDKVEQQMIPVTVRMDGDRPVITVVDHPVDLRDLESELRRFLKATRKTQMLLDIAYDAPQSVMVAVQDAAKGAGMERVSLVLPEKGKK